MRRTIAWNLGSSLQAKKRRLAIQADDPPLSHHDVARLQVPMNDAVVVCLFERPCDLYPEREYVALRQPRLQQPVRQRRSGDELHHQKIHAILRVEVVDRPDVCVSQLRLRQSFLAQLRADVIGSEGCG